MNRISDSELIIEIQAGNILAYEDLINRYQHGVWAFVRRIIRDGAAAQDITQESFISLYRVIGTVDTGKKFSTFLFEIAKNLAISHLRKHRSHVPLEEIHDVASDTRLLEEFTKSETGNLVRKTVNKLPAKFRNVITLYYFRDMSYEEISRKLHIPLNTVRTHLLRAKKLLHTTLKHEI